MKCPECNGRKIIEREAGLISWACPTCKGTGEVAGENPTMEELDRVNNEGIHIPAEAIDSIELPEGVEGGTKYTGFLFQLEGKQEGEVAYTAEELWTWAKEKAALESSWPVIVRMPCGNSQRFDDFVCLPNEDIPCPCGNPNHYIVKFEDNREVADDKPDDNGDDLPGSDNGDRLDTPTTGSGATREPAKSKKSKAKKKTRKRSR